MKRLGVLLILGFLSGALFASSGAQDLNAEYDDKLYEVNRGLAASLASIGKSLQSAKMYKWARDEFLTAIKLDPDCKLARQKLGYTDGPDGWEFDPTVKLKLSNQKTGKDAAKARERWEKKRVSTGKKYSKKFVSLAAWCKKNGMEAEARKHYRQAVEYDPSSKKAREALGYEKRGKSGWISPFEKDLRKRAAEGIMKAPKGSSLGEQTEAEKGMGMKFIKLKSDHFIVESPHMSKSNLEDLVQHAEHAYALWHHVFGQENLFGDSNIEYCVLKDKAQHESFVDRFHTGAPDRKALAKRSAGMGTGTIQECYQAGRGQPSLQDYVIHYTVQSLQGRFAVGQPSSGHNPIWLTEGTALYFTKLMKETAVWSCVDLTKSGTGRQKASKDPKDWAFIIRTFVKEGKDPDINAVIKCTNFAELDGPETVKAWSIVDFLMSEHRDKFIEFCKDLRAGTDNGEKSFKKVFEWSVQDLDNRWRAFAKQAYIGL